MGGLLVTLQSLLDSLDSIQERKKASMAGFLSQQRTGGGTAVQAGGAGTKKKNSLAVRLGDGQSGGMCRKCGTSCAWICITPFPRSLLPPLSLLRSSAAAWKCTEGWGLMRLA